MIKGYKKLKDVEPSSLIRFRDSEYALTSEYHIGDNRHLDTYSAESGEMLHANPDVWVAIIDLDCIEVEAVEEAGYPDENVAGNCTQTSVLNTVG